MNKFEFIENKIKEVKEEIKSRKQWKKAIEHEYGLQRTFKEHRQDELIKLYDTANIMIKYNETILHQYEEMLKELERIEK